MAPLPDPTADLSDEAKAIYDRMAAERSHAEGKASLGQVYVRMFNNPGVAERVGDLGAHLRFHGVLPDAARELIILRFAVREGFGYEWSHHQRAEQQAGLSQEVVAAVTEGAIPGSLEPVDQAVLQAVDAVTAKESIPEDVQEVIVQAYGNAGAVELVALCGLYMIMGYTTVAFDIPLEPGFPRPPF